MVNFPPQEHGVDGLKVKGVEMVFQLRGKKAEYTLAKRGFLWYRRDEDLYSL